MPSRGSSARDTANSRVEKRGGRPVWRPLRFFLQKNRSILEVMAPNDMTYPEDPPIDFGAVEEDCDDDAVVGRPAPWPVLVVDDDEQVHQTTRLVLQKAVLLGRPLELFHTYSAREAFDFLKSSRKVAVVLLDSVMETEDAGVKLVIRIREELQLRNLRIILRTGQPGQAPELDLVENCDVNDYKTKQELTVTRLKTCLITAIRDFCRLEELDQSREALRRILETSLSLAARPEDGPLAEELVGSVQTLGPWPVSAQVYRGVPGTDRWEILAPPQGAVTGRLPSPEGDRSRGYPLAGNRPGFLYLTSETVITPVQDEVYRWFAAMAAKEWGSSRS